MESIANGLSLKNHTHAFPAIQVSYKAPTGKIYLQPGSTEAVFRTILEQDAFLQQQAYCLFAGANGELLCWRLVGSGDVAGTVINTKLVLAIAVQVQACEIILCQTRPHWSAAIQHSTVSHFITAFHPVVAVLGIQFRSYLVLGETHCIDAFEEVDVPPHETVTYVVN